MSTFSIGTLKNRVQGFDPSVAASLARIAKTGKVPEQVRPQDEMVVCRSRNGMMGFFGKVVDECASGEAIEVFGWYATQDPATHAPFLLSGRFYFGVAGKAGTITLFADVDGRSQAVPLDSIGTVARENTRRTEYLATLKAWGITEADHRSRFEAHVAARKAAADAVPVPTSPVRTQQDAARLADGASSTVVAINTDALAAD